MKRALVVVVALVGCEGFQRAETSDLAAGDADAPLDAAPDQAVRSDLATADLAIPIEPDLAVADLAMPDLASADLAQTPDLAPPAPVDVQCSEPWVKGAARAQTFCHARAVMEIEDIFPIKKISIARTAGGRVGIAYEFSFFPDENELHVATFDDSWPSPSPSPVPDINVVSGGLDYYFRQVALAPAPSDAFHVAYLEGGGPGNTVYYRTLNDIGAFGTAEPVAQSFSLDGALDIIAAPGGEVTVTHFNRTSAILASHTRSTGGVWGASKTIRDTIDTAPEGAGHHRLILDGNGKPNVAYHYTFAVGLSQPRFSSFDGVGWSTGKTLDNNNPNGLSGYGIGVVLHEDLHHAVYWAQSGPALVELRLASWRDVNDTPDVSVLEPSIPANFANPLYGSAVAVDRWGQLHIVSLEPDTGGGRLVYRRQVRVGTDLNWLEDVIDDAAVGSDPSRVDLVVDDGGRPHVAYFNAATGKVMYATRRDR